jgi:hypothetical protein
VREPRPLRRLVNRFPAPFSSRGSISTAFSILPADSVRLRRARCSSRLQLCTNAIKRQLRHDYCLNTCGVEAMIHSSIARSDIHLRSGSGSCVSVPISEENSRSRRGVRAKSTALSEEFPSFFRTQLPCHSLRTFSGTFFRLHVAASTRDPPKVCPNMTIS